jgi:hypothetical protein
MSLLDKINQEAKNPTIKVSPRNDELAPNVIQFDRTEDPSKNTAQTEQLIRSLEDELNTFPQVSSKKIGVRLETDLYDTMRKFCDEHGITVETLLESYFTVCQSNQDLTQQVIECAQTRIKQRVRAGNIRSLLTKTRNLLNKQ